MRSSLNHWFPKEQGAAEITEIVLDWSRSIRRRSDAVLPGQINRDVDLRPEAMDGAFSGRPAKSGASRCESRQQSQQSSYSAAL